MASSKDIRRWLQGEAVPGLPSREAWDNPVSQPTPKPLQSPGVVLLDTENARIAIGNKFAIDDAGRDALLRFGKHNGKAVSTLVSEDPDYLDWILKRPEFPEELRDVIKFQIEDQDLPF